MAQGVPREGDPDPAPENPNCGDKVLVWSDEFNINGLPDAEANGVMTLKEMLQAGVIMKHSVIPVPGSENAEVKDGFLSYNSYKGELQGSRLYFRKACYQTTRETGFTAG